MSALIAPWLWAVFTIIAAAAHDYPERRTTGPDACLGTAGATHLRFSFFCRVYAHIKTELVQAVLFGLLFLGDIVVGVALLLRAH